VKSSGLQPWGYHSGTSYKSIGVSQKTIVKVQRRTQELHISWSLDESLTGAALYSGTD